VITVYITLLRLYPRDYRAMFGREMRRAFEITANDCRAAGRACFRHFVLTELTGLMKGAASEWIAKLTTDRTIRGRAVPDLVMMRPVGVTREAHFAGAFLDDNSCSPDT
jgi:hypothetical protein